NCCRGISMSFFEGLCWIITILVTLLGGFLMVNELMHIMTEPALQLAATSASVVAIVAVPYIFTRAVQELGSRSLRKRAMTLLISRLAELAATPREPKADATAAPAPSGLVAGEPMVPLPRV